MKRRVVMPNNSELEVIEKLAAIEHARWADWQQWVFDVCENGHNGNLIIPKKFVKKWGALIYKPYVLLSERSKQSDRKQVARYWPELLAWRNREVEEARIAESEYTFEHSPKFYTLQEKDHWFKERQAQLRAAHSSREDA